MNRRSAELQKTQWGFYQYSPVPSSETLREYYAKKYYQEGLGSYSQSYSDEQVKWWNVRAELIAMMAQQIFPFQPEQTFLDIGCGEGWTMNAMASRGYAVQGFDYSDFGIKKWNQQLLDSFSQGDIYDLLDTCVTEYKVFDIILLGNVIEHVPHPEKLLLSIRSVLSEQSLVIIVAPNDFSDLQSEIITNGFVDEPWWLCYPDHISYFNKNSMYNFLGSLGYSIHGTLGDYPIEYALYSKHTNYAQNRSVGPCVHELRVRHDNYLFGKSPDALLEYYKLLGSIGEGRDLIYFCSQKK